MTPEEYADALAGAQPVVYHEDQCDAPKSLGERPCNCGAIEELRRLQRLEASK